jgi:hypothetical protein
LYVSSQLLTPVGWRDEGLNEKFLEDTFNAGSPVQYNTIHRYDLMGCNPNSNLNELMTKPAWDYSTYQFMVDAKIVADRVGTKVSWNEAGTASCGGIAGIRFIQLIR